MPSPQDVVPILGETGRRKASRHAVHIFFSAVSAGCLLSFAAASAATVTTSSWLYENLPGMARLMPAMIFPYGIILVMLTGVDLCTTSFMYTTIAVLLGRLAPHRALLHWTLTFWGNLGGALFMVSVVFGYGGVFEAEPWRSSILSFATTRQVRPAWQMIFLRGVGCNWLVCIGCFIAAQGQDLTAKILGLYWPIFAFVSLGFDHVVANMFFMPMAIWLSHPQVTIVLYVWKGILPVLLGNMVGGCVCCAGFYYLMYSPEKPHKLFRSSSVLPDIEKGLAASSQSNSGLHDERYARSSGGVT